MTSSHAVHKSCLSKCAEGTLEVASEPCWHRGESRLDSNTQQHSLHKLCHLHVLEKKRKGKMEAKKVKSPFAKFILQP
jgi:hypothetical protein